MRRLLVRTRLSVLLAGLLLVPLAGVATGGPASVGGVHGATGTCASTRATAVSLRSIVNPFTSAHPTCFMDQYGNSYTWTTDAEHRYLYGTVTVPTCTETSWPLLGSYVHKVGFQYELTAVNPLGDNDPSCVPGFKIKGAWPNGAWYYTFGYGSQEFTFAVCGSKPIAAGRTGGPHR